MEEPESPSASAEKFDALAASPVRVEARFTCARHGTEAGAVRLRGGYLTGWMVDMESFAGRVYQRIDESRAEVLREDLHRADVREIHAANVEWAPFYCPHCDAVYCGECWRTWLVFDPEWPDFLEETRGVCPHGHERMLLD